MSERGLSKTVTYCGQPMVVACDANCDKAFGANGRPRVSLSSNDDDYALLADHEVGIAPIDPGTYEGGHAKPTQRPMTADAMNKWCVRECERCASARPPAAPVLPDFSRRLFNLGSSERAALSSSSGQGAE